MCVVSWWRHLRVAWVEIGQIWNLKFRISYEPGNSLSFVFVSNHLPFPISTGDVWLHIVVPPCTVHHMFLIFSFKVNQLHGLKHCNLLLKITNSLSDILPLLLMVNDSHDYCRKGTTPVSKMMTCKLHRFCQTGSLYRGNWPCWVQFWPYFWAKLTPSLLFWFFFPKFSTQSQHKMANCQSNTMSQVFLSLRSLGPPVLVLTTVILFGCEIFQYLLPIILSSCMMVYFCFIL